MAAERSAEKLLSFPFRQVAIGSPPISFSSPKCSSLSYPFEQMGRPTEKKKKNTQHLSQPHLGDLKILKTHFDPLANPFWRPLAPARALSARARASAVGGGAPQGGGHSEAGGFGHHLRSASAWRAARLPLAVAPSFGAGFSPGLLVGV